MKNQENQDKRPGLYCLCVFYTGNTTNAAVDDDLPAAVEDQTAVESDLQADIGDAEDTGGEVDAESVAHNTPAVSTMTLTDRCGGLVVVLTESSQFNGY